ncbi:rod shape-determining protein MreC [Dysgonomonas sp. PH5-45]|uniref:rod shape-determining protein MreC n=1 Tax=unclassified Dysgonomonas TaxID=2630389 RepID=UPI0024736AA1|nr:MULTISPECIES: rod shape-determining protein MreC [unclassified Dysgonomonas]MDH6355574.1 rod shape-determining protein MreC [Dysgonomonas sp. PH5-45]MDH6388471.1 rod shape-determining protein MreC [Dysgonomonas sp. PH5-37]
MRNLIAFLIKNGAWFFFIFLEIICFYFIFQGNSYQRSIYLNSSNEIVGRVYSISGTVRSYFGLKTDNEELLAQNSELQKKVWAMEKYITTLQSDSVKINPFVADSLRSYDYDVIVAHVENNSVNKIDNTITVNKGSNHGVKPEMGVVSPLGVIGIVVKVSPNYSIVQPILNSKNKLSCKIKGTNNPGTLVWEGNDYRYANLNGFPRHEKWQKGDTIVTSGFSSFFPEGVIIGKIEKAYKESDDNFISLRVRLATDFSSLSNVFILDNKKGQERLELEKSMNANDR